MKLADARKLYQRLAELEKKLNYKDIHLKSIKDKIAVLKALLDTQPAVIENSHFRNIIEMINTASLKSDVAQDLQNFETYYLSMTEPRSIPSGFSHDTTDEISDDLSSDSEDIEVPSEMMSVATTILNEYDISNFYDHDQRLNDAENEFISHLLRCGPKSIGNDPKNILKQFEILAAAYIRMLKGEESTRDIADADMKDFIINGDESKRIEHAKILESALKLAPKTIQKLVDDNSECKTYQDIVKGVILLLAQQMESEEIKTLEKRNQMIDALRQDEKDRRHAADMKLQAYAESSEARMLEILRLEEQRHREKEALDKMRDELLAKHLESISTMLASDDALPHMSQMERIEEHIARTILQYRDVFNQHIDGYWPKLIVDRRKIIDAALDIRAKQHQHNSEGEAELKEKAQAYFDTIMEALSENQATVANKFKIAERLLTAFRRNELNRDDLPAIIDKLMDDVEMETGLDLSEALLNATKPTTTGQLTISETRQIIKLVQLAEISCEYKTDFLNLAIDHFNELEEDAQIDLIDTLRANLKAPQFSELLGSLSEALADTVSLDNSPTITVSTFLTKIRESIGSVSHENVESAVEEIEDLIGQVDLEYADPDMLADLKHSKSALKDAIHNLEVSYQEVVSLIDRTNDADDLRELKEMLETIHAKLTLINAARDAIHAVEDELSTTAVLQVDKPILPAPAAASQSSEDRSVPVSKPVLKAQSESPLPLNHHNNIEPAPAIAIINTIVEDVQEREATDHRVKAKPVSVTLKTNSAAESPPEQEQDLILQRKLDEQLSDLEMKASLARTEDRIQQEMQADEILFDTLTAQLELKRLRERNKNELQALKENLEHAAQERHAKISRDASRNKMDQLERERKLKERLAAIDDTYEERAKSNRTKLHELDEKKFNQTLERNEDRIRRALRKKQQEKDDALSDEKRKAALARLEQLSLQTNDHEQTLKQETEQGQAEYLARKTARLREKEQEDALRQQQLANLRLQQQADADRIRRENRQRRQQEQRDRQAANERLIELEERAKRDRAHKARLRQMAEDERSPIIDSATRLLNKRRAESTRRQNELDREKKERERETSRVRQIKKEARDKRRQERKHQQEAQAIPNYDPVSGDIISDDAIKDALADFNDLLRQYSPEHQDDIRAAKDSFRARRRPFAALNEYELRHRPNQEAIRSLLSDIHDFKADAPARFKKSKDILRSEDAAATMDLSKATKSSAAMFEMTHQHQNPSLNTYQDICIALNKLEQSIAALEKIEPIMVHAPKAKLKLFYNDASIYQDMSPDSINKHQVQIKRLIRKIERYNDDIKSTTQLALLNLERLERRRTRNRPSKESMNGESTTTDILAVHASDNSSKRRARNTDEAPPNADGMKHVRGINSTQETASNEEISEPPVDMSENDIKSTDDRLVNKTTSLSHKKTPHPQPIEATLHTAPYEEVTATLVESRPFNVEVKHAEFISGKKDESLDSNETSATHADIRNDDTTSTDAPLEEVTATLVKPKKIEVEVRHAQFISGGKSAKPNSSESSSEQQSHQDSKTFEVLKDDTSSDDFIHSSDDLPPSDHLPIVKIISDMLHRFEHLQDEASKIRRGAGLFRQDNARRDSEIIQASFANNKEIKAMLTALQSVLDVKEPLESLDKMNAGNRKILLGRFLETTIKPDKVLQQRLQDAWAKQSATSTVANASASTVNANVHSSLLLKPSAMKHPLSSIDTIGLRLLSAEEMLPHMQFSRSIQEPSNQSSIGSIIRYIPKIILDEIRESTSPILKDYEILNAGNGENFIFIDKRNNETVEFPLTYLDPKVLKHDLQKKIDVHIDPRVFDILESIERYQNRHAHRFATMLNDYAKFTYLIKNPGARQQFPALYSTQNIQRFAQNYKIMNAYCKDSVFPDMQNRIVEINMKQSTVALRLKECYASYRNPVHTTQNGVRR